jgi:hypothetical protein
MRTIFGQNIRTHEKDQILGVGQGLVSLLTFKKSINAHYLMTLSDFQVGNVVTGVHVAFCHDESFVLHLEIIWCLKGLDLVQIPIRLIFRCSISDNFRECDDFYVFPDNLNLIHLDHSKFIQ